MRTELITCDGCGTPLPGDDKARYTCFLVCYEGPNRGYRGDVDLCGYCANLVRVIIEAQTGKTRSKPVCVELAAQ